MITFFDLEHGQALRIGPDVRVVSMGPRGNRSVGRAHLALDCPARLRIARTDAPAVAVPVSTVPTLERLPGVTRRPGPPLRRRPAKGGGA